MHTYDDDDSMTAEETVDFRQEIMAECEKHRIP
jgi:hypothetical protein